LNERRKAAECPTTEEKREARPGHAPSEFRRRR
jgi:hypothetical protein